MLEINDLYKKYGKFTALNGLNLTIGDGELFGFVGPNGAGKTTTMKIIAGLLYEDSGSILLDGVNIHTNLAKRKNMIGYMPDFFGVYDNLKTYEYMEFYASVYGIYKSKAKQKINELLDMVSLLEQAENYVDNLSRGMKQKLCLARCLIQDPQLLILDEPSSGLDPKARYEVKEILKQLNEQGKTIIISSHILPELAQMCSTIGIIQGGKMVLKGTVKEISHQMKLSSPLILTVVEGIEAAVEELKNNSLAENISIRGNQISIGFHGDQEDEASLLSKVVGNGARISAFFRQEGNLESLFLELTKQEEETHEN